LIVLGIDPGSQITGYGVVERVNGRLREILQGEIRPKEEFLSAKLVLIFNRLKDIMATVGPQAVAIENIFYGRNVKSLITQGHVRGVAILAASTAKIPIYDYTPLEIKKSVVGYGQATKIQVQKMVQVILNLKEMPRPDAADALAVAICHINFMKKEPL